MGGQLRKRFKLSTSCISGPVYCMLLSALRTSYSKRYRTVVIYSSQWRRKHGGSGGWRPLTFSVYRSTCAWICSVHLMECVLVMADNWSPPYSLHHCILTLVPEECQIIIQFLLNVLCWTIMYMQVYVLNK